MTVLKVIYIYVLVASSHGRLVAKDETIIEDISANLIPKNDDKLILPIESTTVKIASTTETDKPHSIHKNTTTNEVSNLSEHVNENPPDKDEITDNTIEGEDKLSVEDVRVDNGTALILTPLLLAGRLEEARNASRVNPELFLGIESYSGYFTVNETYNSNIFFWYFPVEKKPVNETPWIVWLQGGPGASSLTGLFDEIGPFTVNGDGVLVRKPFSWLRNHSLVFIENPVGSGYSFTDHVDGYTKDMATYSSQLYSAVSQLVRLFPELRGAPLFVAGESYAGKYVPALGSEIHRRRDVPGQRINLQGLIVGNAYVDPAMIQNLTWPFYYFGLLGKEQMDIVQPLLASFQQNIADNNNIEAKKKWNSLITLLLFLTHQRHAYNFLRDELDVGKYSTFLRRSDVKRAIHVGDIHFNFVNMTVNTYLAPDFLSSSKPLFEELLDHYRVLAYCGHLDEMLPCVFTSENYRTWRWSGSEEFLNATRFPYIFNKRLAGYHRTGGRLTEVVVRGAGHMAAMDAPAPVQSLVARWTRNEPLSQHFGLLEGSFVQEYVRNNSLVHYL